MPQGKLPRSRGIGPGLVGYVIFESAIICAMVLALMNFSQSAIVMVVLLVVLGGLTLIGLVTRIRTVFLVARRQIAVRKTISLTEAFIPFEGPANRVLDACRSRLESSASYVDVTTAGETMRVTLRGDFLTKKSTGVISIVDEGILHVTYELVNGGAIWADSGKHERAAHFLRGSLSHA